MELYLILLNKDNNKQFKKYFKCEFDMDKFIRKLRYSKRLEVIKDSRSDYYDLYK